MSKPWIHAESSSKKFGGKPEDYIEIHSFIDSSKGTIPTNVHRALTHTSWFLSTILERVKFINSHPAPNNTFPTIINSKGDHISVRDIGEQHILEDFKNKFIPTAQDYLQEIEFKDWMQNGNGLPPSFQKMTSGEKTIRNIPLKETTYDGSKMKPFNQPELPTDDRKFFPRMPGLVD